MLVRLLAAWPQQQPNYMDAAYSYVNALNLAAGRGFVEDFVWNYLDNPEQPPRPSHLYWMPLTSILAWLGMVAAGAGYRAAQMPFVVLSALLAPISYWTAHALTGHRWLSWLAGLFAIFSGFYVPFWAAIDNFAPFAVTGSLALLFAWRGITNYQLPITNYQLSVPHLMAAGAFIGLAHLARADGLLLLIAIPLTCLLRLLFHSLRIRKNYSSSTVRRSAPSECPLGIGYSSFASDKGQVTNDEERTGWLRLIWVTLFLILGYTLIMLPWFIRNWQVIGSPLPAAGSQTIWLIGYDDLFSYNRELSAQTFFAQGIGSVLQGRWWALTTNLQTVLAVWGMIFLTPLALIGGWRLRRHLLIQLAGMYAPLLFVAMTLVFAFPGARGGLFHSGAALLPFIYAAAVVGLDWGVDWAAARRRGWNVTAAKRVFGVGLVVMAVALSSFIYYGRVIKNNTWNNADRLYPAVAAWVAAQNPTGPVMIGNPPAYRYHGGGLSVIVPNEDLANTLHAARNYGVEYLVLDRNHPTPLAEVYHNPAAYPELSLAQIFGQGTGNEIYVFKIVRE